MTDWPVCPLCQVETARLDQHGLCPRVSPTHAAVRSPDDWPAESHPALWALILSGRPVFPISRADAERMRQRANYERKGAAA